MSEDEVKPQSEEPTPEPVKAEKVEKVEVKKEEEEKKEEVIDKEEEEIEEHEKADEMEVEEEKAVKKKGRPKKEAGAQKKEATAIEEEPEGEGKEEPTTPEKSVPLYDQPLEMSGKRDRKKVERFIQEEKKEELKIEGTGTPLGEIPFIEYSITKSSSDELRTLHRIAFNRRGSSSEIKKNLRKFNGFPYTKDDKEFEAKSAKIEKIFRPELSRSLKILGLEVSGSKGVLIERLLSFMVKPEDLGKQVKKAKKSVGGGRGRGRPKQSLNKSKNTSVTNEDEESDAGSSSEVSGAEEEPKKAAPKKKVPVKKDSINNDSDSDSDDEPLAKKAKQPPSDGELKATVKKILDGANLEEVTMKSVCRQVYDSYPDFDLTHKKDFIKETVKSIIS